MKKTNFERLLKRYLTGQVTDEERVKLEAWLDAMKSGKGEEVELSPDEEEKLFQKIIAKKDVKEIDLPDTARKDSTSGNITRIVAGLVGIILVSFAGWYIGHQNSTLRAYASSGPTEKIQLSDGSLVWMKGTSQLNFHDDDDARYAIFSGDALFEVAKDADHPFVIQCGNVTMRVVGTSFTINTQGDSVTLRVLTGKVRVSWNDSAGVDVIANEKFVYGHRAFVKDSLSQHEALRAMAGTEYNLQLTNVMLSDAIAKLQKKFDVTITIADTTAGYCRITADLTDRPLDNALQILTEVLDVQYEMDGRHVIIKGSGCN